MNAFAPGDFGEMSDLLRALGLVNGTGEFNSDWVANPDDYLKDILADDDTNTKAIVASFARASDGTVSIGTIQISVNSAKLYDEADQSGLLDTETTTTGSVPPVPFTAPAP